MKKTGVLLAAFGLAIPLVALISITIGAADISIGQTVDILAANLGFGNHGGLPANYQTIILKLRLPRILLALSSGAALAVAGTVLQGVFHNPMADPYVMGVSSGAAFAVAVAIFIGFTSQITIQLFAMAGSFLSILLLLSLAGLASRKGEPASLLLAGIAISVFLSSGVSLLIYLSHAQAQKIIFWTFGSLSATGWDKLPTVIAGQIIGIILIVIQWKDLNLLSQGDESARSLGLVPDRARIRLLLSASFVTAMTVSATGIIGFAGLMIPHAMRLATGPNHRSLLPLSALGGAVFLVISDTLGRIIVPSAEIPVGVITSIIGAPYLLYILIIRNKKRDT
ncbi:MAG: iron ABC transporter permease [Spirochaetaceae bacterium]|nr:MAG: iron ABC transporter permease [Spirochaetaceae bacterium]